MLAFYLSLLETDDDQTRFAQFYESYERRLYRAALSIVQSPAMAEDAVQDAMLKIIDHFDEFKKIENSCQDLGAWSVTIVKNVSLSMLRKENRHQELPEDWDAPDPDGAESVSDAHRLVAHIRALPEIYRSVLELRLVAGWSSREVAALFHLKENTVDMRVSRGRAILRKRLREEGYEIDGVGV